MKLKRETYSLLLGETMRMGEEEEFEKQRWKRQGRSSKHRGNMSKQPNRKTQRLFGEHGRFNVVGNTGS